jgi:shikimate dehydrogenase
MSAPLPAVAGVIGWPVAHSKSPRIHRFWLEALGIDGDYGRFPVHPDRLGAAIRALPALGLRGVNVTVPHKQAVLPFLDRIDPTAAAIGAVNTVVVEEGGSAGYNSDAAGFLEPVRQHLRTRALRPGAALILGAGGAARAIAHALAGEGFAVHVVYRDTARARALVHAVGGAGDGPDALYALAAHARPQVAGDGLTLLVNTTTLGMSGAPPLPVALDDVAAGTLVYDIVYAPLETPLLAEARRRGLPTIDGLAMLIGQAAIAFGLFYGAPPPRDRDAALRALLTV